MVFSSQIFIFYFLPLVLALYYALPFRARTALIAVASYVFYGWANPIWAVIMFFGCSVDYVCGRLLLRLSRLPDVAGLPPVIGPEVPRTRAMKAVLGVSIATNLGLLGAFKYTGFAAENVNALGRLLGLGSELLPVLHLVLPVATVSLILVAHVSRMVRSELVDALHTDYVRAARLKGLPEAQCLRGLG